ncbi:serine hydrolase domain-containing protein [Streptomyces iconiensis]|uniref:Serine hydrolase domain-containing protein n=1 Tax=Streptomyces iconiensis TaxID=1384038 RepID=A0ABT7A1Z3_9ACTN|nr:serine hydrolase domain-containing protein [Streptomyces iconiensis]MDJ1135084.1 serine hydrolase domain-containing protein [Streptomyces iconiensis]
MDLSCRSRRRTGTSAMAFAALLTLSLLGGCADQRATESPAEPPAAGAGAGASEGAGERKKEGKAQKESVADYLRRTLPKGASGTVIAARGDHLAYCGGFGTADRAAGTPASCHTVYDVMSITKQFTSAAILKLEVMGRLRVSDPIDRFLGPIPEDKKNITIKHLLTHTSGLAESLGDDYDPVTRNELVRRALTSKLRSAPGKEFHYSNTAYSMLAAIVENASGEGYEPFLAQHLFAPAGMKHTGYVLPRWPRRRIAVEYDNQGRSQGRPVDHPWAIDGPYWNLRGNGGMLSTAHDMLRWHRALSDNSVLPARARRQLFAPRIRVPETDDSYGYGWNIRDTTGERLAWHDGGNGWSLALLARSLRDGVLVYWVSNHAYQKGKWNLEDQAQALTLGIADRVRGGSR